MRRGSPIRTSADHRSFAPSRGFSQLIASFFASWSQGILRAPLSLFSFVYVLYRYRPPRSPVQYVNVRLALIPRSVEVTLAGATIVAVKLCVSRLSRKEVFQPHLPVRLPCYDLAPVICFALDRSSRSRSSGTPDSHGLTGGVYKARERIHRAMADARLLANPASWSRVADSNPNYGALYWSAPHRCVASLCAHHCNTCVAPDVRAVLI